MPDTVPAGDYKVKDITRRLGPQGNRHGRGRDARPDGDPRGIRRAPSRSKGARIAGCLHMTIQTAVLIGRWRSSAPPCAGRPATSSPPRTTPPPPWPPSGTPVFAWKGMIEDEFWWCIEQTIHGPDGWTPNMILDDGGDLTLLMHEKYPDLLKDVRGLSEETTTGVHRLCEMARGGHAAGARDQRQRQRHQVEVRQPLRLPREPGGRDPPRHRRDDGRQGRGGERLRRCRQGLRRQPAQRRLPRDGDRGRSDLRAAGGDGRLRGRDDGGCRAARRHLRHRHRQRRRHHASTTCGA